MRVWEHGNGETQAWAQVRAPQLQRLLKTVSAPRGEDITVKLRSGDLIVNYTNECITLTDDSNLVFTGQIEY